MTADVHVITKPRPGIWLGKGRWACRPQFFDKELARFYHFTEIHFAFKNTMQI